MEVVLLLSAERDLQEAYNWVEEHRRGREEFFLQDVELRLEHLKRFPPYWATLSRPIPPFAPPEIPFWYLLRCRVKQSCYSCGPRSSSSVSDQSKPARNNRN